MFLREQVEIYNSLDGSAALKNAYDLEDSLLHIGTEALARANVVKGLTMFTDFDALAEMIVTEDEEESDED